ncbi:MAG: hypothetical protein KDB05_32405, partial [Planctomycetales bacterium]|nr:hypothetical protein [Planctomycetales bacterium]
VPEMLAPPRLFKAGEYESLEAALAEANAWIKEYDIKIVNVETVVLPNIWSRYEEGTSDVALGTSGEMPSHWHQFVRVWYQG